MVTVVEVVIGILSPHSLKEYESLQAVRIKIRGAPPLSPITWVIGRGVSGPRLEPTLPLLDIKLCGGACEVYPPTA